MRNNAIQVPRVFRSEPELLKSDLERFGLEVERHANNLGNVFARRIDVRSIVTNGDLSAEFEVAYGVSPLDGQTVNVFLPSPQRKNAGRVLSIIRKTLTGIVYVYAPNSTVNGRDRILLDASIGWAQFLFDGYDYYGDKSHGVPSEEEI